MLFANVNGERTEATPKATGTCPFCKGNVFSKCGDINVWHWSHQRDMSCDSWYEPETEWHKNWKLAFGKTNCEVIVTKDGIKHIADVLTENGIVIELQNSPMPNQTATERETFYGEQMIWIINGIHFKNNFSLIEQKLSFGEEWYWRNEVHHTEFGTVDKETGELVSQPIRDLIFNWNYPRKSWTYSSRPIYIDFGDRNLVRIISGMGTKQGTCRYESKEIFLEEHNGDLTYLDKLISSN